MAHRTISPPGPPDLAALGAFVRTRRRAAGLSMQELASLADRGRSTIHRLEHGPATKTGAVEQPNPCVVAGVLVALHAHENQVRPLVGDGTWGDDVLQWMPLLEDPHATIDLGEFIEQRRRAANLSRDDLARRCGVTTYILLLLEHGASTHHRGRGRERHDPWLVARVLAAVAATDADVAPMLSADHWGKAVRRELATRASDDAHGTIRTRPVEGGG